MSSKKTSQPGSCSPVDPAAKKAKGNRYAQEQGSSGQSAVQLCLHALVHCGEQLAHIQDASTLGKIAAQARQLQQAAQLRLQALKSNPLQPKQPEQPSQQQATQQHDKQQKQKQERQPNGQQHLEQQQRLLRQQQLQQPLKAKPLQIVEDRQPYYFNQAGCKAAAGAATGAAASRPLQQYMPPLQQQYKGNASVVALAERCAQARGAYTAGAAAKVAAPGAAAAAVPQQQLLGHNSGTAGAAGASSFASDSDTSSGNDTSSSSDSSSSSGSHPSNRRSSDSSDSSRSDSDSDGDSIRSGSAALPSPAAAGKASQQQHAQQQQQQQHQQQQQCLICLQLCPPQSLMANKLMAACNVCTAGALQGGTSSLARCPKRSCGKQDVRLGPKGWHSGLTGQKHYISVSSTGFRVHYTCKQKNPKRKKPAPEQGTPVKVVAVQGGVRKKQCKQDKDKKRQSK